MFLAIVLTLAASVYTVSADDCVEGKINNQTCADYIGDDFCQCKRTLKNGQTVAEYCCNTCPANAKLDCCLDRVSPSNRLPVRGLSGLTSCIPFGLGLQRFCPIDFIGGELGYCCATCNNVDTGCVDSPILVNGKNCAQLVAEDPCWCTEKVKDNNNKNIKIKKSCKCACKNKDLSGCGCRDLIGSPRHVSKIPYKLCNSDGCNTTDYTSCSTLAAEVPWLCTIFRDETCCKSCAGVCENNPYYRRTVKNKQTKEKCTKCTCDEILAFDVDIARKECKKRIKKKKLSGNCCKMCASLLKRK